MTLGHLRHLQSLLVTAESALYDADRRLWACQKALDEAKTAFNITQHEKRTLGRSCDGLRRAIVEAREAIQYSLLFPDEILSLIFAHALAGATASIPTRKIDWPLATLPRTLRLVCRRWDSVARGTPELWTYVVVPATLEFVARRGFPAYLALQLKRSGSKPLDVLIDGRYDYTSNKASFRFREDAVSQQAEFLRKAFDVLVTESTTARIAMLAVSGGPPKHNEAYAMYYSPDQNNIRHLTMGLLRLPTPLLEEAYLHMDPEDRDADEPWDTSVSDLTPPYLPVAPKLRVLDLTFMPITWYPPHPGLPSLEKLTFVFRLLHESHLVGMLSLCPALREVTSGIENLTSDPLPGVTLPAAVTLPVRSLVICTGDYSTSICDVASLPNLTSLNIPPWRMFSGNLHVRFAPTLTDLDLDEDDDLLQADIDRLGVLTHLERFAIWVSDDIDLRHLVDCLCRPASPMWPRLKHFEVGGSVGGNGGAELVRLARHRAAAQVGTMGGTPIAALETIRVRDWEVSNWVLAQLRAILGEEKVILIDKR